MKNKRRAKHEIRVQLNMIALTCPTLNRCVGFVASSEALQRGDDLASFESLVEDKSAEINDIEGKADLERP
jgi:hypothetical protein